jgi:tRNA G18 (ribose-2'-O)-methylase SpoU
MRDIRLLLDNIRSVHNIGSIFRTAEGVGVTKIYDYRKVKTGNKSLLIFGNEVEGVSKFLLKLADKIIEIPLKGIKESLNVSVAAGIVLFRI